MYLKCTFIYTLTVMNKALKCSQQVAGDKPGVKVDDYWEVGKAQLQDPTKFLDSLFKYDKVGQLYRHLHYHTMPCTCL